MSQIATLQNATLTFGKFTALNNLSLAIPKGKIVGLIGPSGAGKTSAIQALLGMKKLNAGFAKILDTPMPNRNILQKIGYMGQTTALYETLTAQDNLTFFGELLNLQGDALQKRRSACLELVQLDAFAKKRVADFSGGMKRRLSLAITLLSEPEFLVLDEPTVGIDPILRRDIWRELRKLSEGGTTILVTTHVMDEAECCDEIGLIIEGKLIAYGAPKTLKENYQASTIEEVFIKGEEANA